MRKIWIEITNDLLQYTGKRCAQCNKTIGSYFRELYVDGNDLQCEGLIELVKLCADHAEEESYQREQERARKQEEEAEAERRGENTFFCS